MRKLLKGLFPILTALLCNSQSVSALSGGGNSAHLTDGIVYKDKHVRFTVVSDGLVRLEYSPKGKFVDDKSQVAVNRLYPESNAKVISDKQYVTIQTPKLELKYKKNSGPFTADNLTIESRGDIKPFSWHPGIAQKENLMGTTRTLDRWDGPDIMVKNKDGKYEPKPGRLETGLLARDGWTLLDDSRSYLFDNDPQLEWVKERKNNKGSQDWYFMAYCNDYKGALKDFTTLAGQISLPPRYAFGYWWSRWWAYSEHEFRDLIQSFNDYQIPLEVLVIDMDWHYTDADHGGWTGWTWNRRLFPEPEKFLNYLRDNNLKVTLNLHPASGVKKFEAAYPDIARENGIDPATEKDVPWVTSDKRFINSIFKHILNPMTDQGVTFWWLDWQQWPEDKAVAGLNNTWWLNYCFFTDMERNSKKRPMLYHRCGGLGNHRYQIGFSGDAMINFPTLAFQPYFTSTASNVGYAFWGHDLGGHVFSDEQTVNDPELVLRWVQFGVFTPIFRTHATKEERIERRIWKFPNFPDMLDAVKLRYALFPYIYTMARKTHDTGIGMCRPLYYEYPEMDEAYNYEGEYFFGDDILVAPIVEAAEKGKKSAKEIWFPEGEWWDVSGCRMIKGPGVNTLEFALDEIPYFYKAGSMIPFNPSSVKNVTERPEELVLNVVSGADGSASLYEDSGDNSNYETEFAATSMTHSFSGKKEVISISPRRGSDKGLAKNRSWKVLVHNAGNPKKVSLNGKKLKSAAWSYDAPSKCLTINSPSASCLANTDIEISY